MIDELQAARQELETARRALSLIQAIDEIRDTKPEPIAMLSAIVNLLADEMTTELCMLTLCDRETKAIELKAVHKRDGFSNRLVERITRDLAERVMQLEAATIWPGGELLIESDQDGVWHGAAVPIIIGEDERLGGMLLARRTPFSDADLRLLSLAEDHIDSAVIQGYAHYDRQQRLKELETIYLIDRIRDQDLSFDEMLNAVLHELEGIIAAEIGFIMLYDQSGRRLEMRAATHKDLFQMSPHVQKVYEMADSALRDGRLVCHNDLQGTLRSVMCLPLILNERVIGVLGVANGSGQMGFRQDDQRLLSAIGSQMDTAIFESLEQRHLRQVLGRSVDPRVMEKLLAQSDAGFLEGRRALLTVLYADVRGSTSLAERTEPERLVQFINSYLEAMTRIILDYGGTLDKFVGDEVMALFGAPVPLADHALRAAQVGLAMQKAHEVILREWTAQGGDNAPIGVGIATGELIVGEMGSAQRTDYTAIGKAANLGARICSVAQGGQVLICADTYALIKEQITAAPIHGMEFKGVAGPVTVYEVTAVK